MQVVNIALVYLYACQNGRYWGWWPKAWSEGRAMVFKAGLQEIKFKEWSGRELKGENLIHVVIIYLLSNFRERAIN